MNDEMVGMCDRSFSVDLTNYCDSNTHQMCRYCWEYLPLEDFSLNKRARNGRHSYCKKCCSKRNCQYIKKNPHIGNANNAKRAADKLNRTPAWADLDKIREFYEEAQRLTKETGIQYSVDHIYPLRGEKISGLHVETNLQVIPLSENISKNNKFET